MLAAGVEELPRGLVGSGGKSVLHGSALAKFTGGARPLSDEAPEASPA